MNKKEQAAFAELQEELRLVKAWRLTENVLPDIPVPNSGYTQGWTFNSYSKIVEYAWSESVVHGRGEWKKHPRNGSQGGVALYSTKEIALRAMRYWIEQRFMRELAAIDTQIEQALTPQT
jgi:hypothetical protein